jgi:peptidoglycan hydrolase CwlO-like protein
MTLKIKLIIAAAVALLIITSVVSVFVYINHLNNKITDLNVTLEEQNNEIKALNCQIDSLEKNVESLHETMNITNDYIENLEKTRQDEMALKDEVYQTITEDPEAKDWYNTEIPDSLLEVLLRESASYTCDE